MKRHLSTLLLMLILVIGLSLLLYPTVSDYWNSLHQSRAITSYAEQVSDMNSEEYERIWAEAVAYNRELAQSAVAYALTPEQEQQYGTLLNVGGTGEMVYIEIPSIKVSLPIYHGTDDTVLQHAIGHIEWSSLPVGGESSHCVLSGHRGLPSAKLFTNLDKLSPGDTFILRVLDEVLTYEVDQILIVEPSGVDSLRIEEGQDYCTLVTCTPYGINTHRLLVRGHRVENAEEARSVYVTADAMQIEPLLVAPVIAAPMLLLLLIALLLPARPRKRNGDDTDESH